MKAARNYLIIYVFSLLGLNLILALSFLLVRYPVNNCTDMKDILTLSAIFSVISIITFSVFLRGVSREPDAQTLHTLVAVSLKFLMDMVLALLWFFVVKKTCMTSVIMFFVIYLTLTLYLVFFILKILRNKSL